MTCPVEHRHGETGTCYVGHGCRCADCRRGRAEYEYWRARNRARSALVDGTGTRRRLQALARLGWSARAIAGRFGYTEQTVSGWMRADRVSRRTAAMVVRWYDAMSMTLPVAATRFDRYSIGSTQGRARAAGWAPPLAWDDDTIDDPAAVPAPASEPTDERGTEARRDRVRELHRLRWADGSIASALGVNIRTIQRDRDHLGLPGWSMHDLQKMHERKAS